MLIKEFWIHRKKEVIVSDLKEAGITLVVRAWANREVFWATKNEIGEEMKNVLSGNNVVFPSNIVKIIDETPESGEPEKTQA
jgi:small conductance mechanosensitive channel